MIKSLKYYTIKCILNYINSLDNIGDVPYSLIKDILFKCHHNQLLKIEENSPELIKYDDEIWFQLFKSTFIKQFQDLTQPPSSWRDLFLQEQTNQLNKLNKASNNLKLNQKQLELDKLNKQTIITNNLLPPKSKRSSSSLYQKSKQEARMSISGRNARFLKPFKRNLTPQQPAKPVISSFSKAKQTKVPVISTSVKVANSVAARNTQSSSISTPTKSQHNQHPQQIQQNNQSAQSKSIFLPKKRKK